MIGEDQIVRELSRYLAKYPADQAALMPLYDTAIDHSRRRACAHEQRCPLVTAGAVVDEQARVLCLRNGGRYALAETELEDEDDTLGGAALRPLAEQIGVRNMRTHPDLQSAFLVDVTGPGQHGYGPRLRVGFRFTPFTAARS
ncbi:NUDIX hydrolase [Streptomyces sp. NPDC048290]|uniref:NUDIX hydrolase n=1 Tax=Streptomyces sp. NPDC048290 TaxID=3155811 RepID=UPI00344851B5